MRTECRIFSRIQNENEMPDFQKNILTEELGA